MFNLGQALSLLRLTRDLPHGGLLERTPRLGVVLYVSSTLGVAGDPGTIDAPITSIAAAVALITSVSVAQNRGDTIICLENHVEPISSATILGISRNQIKIISLGSGSARAKLNFTTVATSTISVTGTNVEIHNCILNTAVASVAAMFTSPAVGLKLRNCDITASGSGTLFAVVACNGADNTSDGLEMTDCNINLTDTATRSIITTAGDIDSLVFSRNKGVIGANNTYSVIMAATAKDFTNINMHDNRIQRKNSNIDTVPAWINSDTTANTGMITNNIFSHLDTASTLGGVDCTGVGLENNQETGVVDTSGLELPVADDNT